jgi:Rrf2 family protein
MSRIATLSEAGSIAIHSLVLIARTKDSMNAQQIAGATGSSRHHIAKILQRLVKEGYINSVRGPKGGFAMRKDPSDITMLDIYETIEGKIEETKCPMGHSICAFDKCLFGNVISKMTHDFISYMKGKTLADYL